MSKSEIQNAAIRRFFWWWLIIFWTLVKCDQSTVVIDVTQRQSKVISRQTNIWIIYDLSCCAWNKFCILLFSEVEFQLPKSYPTQQQKITQSNKVQCTLDTATGLRHKGWGRYRQRGRYLWTEYTQDNFRGYPRGHRLAGQMAFMRLSAQLACGL